MRPIAMKPTLKTVAAAIGLSALVILTAASLVLYQKAVKLGPLPLAKTQDISKTVIDRNGRLLRAFTTSSGHWRLPVRSEDLDENYLKALFSYEDKRFLDHPGVDVFALLRASWQLLTEQRIVSGGSTLTMQLARMIDVRESRSFDAKINQILRAIQIERSLTKKEILKAYLTLAPFGGNLEGVRAGTLAYFGKEPKRLSWSEIALLVALPQSPELRRPDRYAKNAKRARDRVLDRLHKAGLISRAETTTAKKAIVPNKRQNFPQHAPHLAEREVKRYPNTSIHKLTLDRSLQKRLEKLAHNHAKRAGPHLSAAILVIEHQQGVIRAHIGSASYLDETRFGAIDMVEAVRSPGSALKPFIYGLAFEEGLAHPQSLIEDAPVRFGNYAPENFDKLFRGTVTIRKALQKSLNIPAVKVLASLGPARFSARVKTANFGVDMPNNLTIALGGTGLRLSELARLYATLARNGRPTILRHRQDKPQNSPAATARTNLLSPLASWYVANILAGTTPPKNANGENIAYKTGTSYGHRDAWAVGFDGKHTIAVWIGRPDGAATPGLTGFSKAAPLLFDAFTQTEKTRTPLPSTPTNALMVDTAQLPKPLLYVREGPRGFDDPRERSNPLKIIFPPHNSELDLFAGAANKRMPLALKAEGGTLPLTWLANGAPLQDGATRRRAFFKTTEQGFHEFSVIDAGGQVARVSVRIK